MRTARIILPVLLVITLIGLSALPGHAAPPMVPVNPGTTNLISWWSMDETSGTRNDSHGTNHLTDNNTVGYVAGKQGNAAYMIPANSESLSISDNASVSTGDINFTYCLWSYMSAKTSGIAQIYKQLNSSNKEYYVQYDTGTDRYRFAYSNNGTTLAAIAANNFGSPAASQWHFICFWHDATNNQVGIQVNNGTADTAAYSSGVADGVSPLQFFANGYIDEVVFYKKVLSADEREWLYNSGTGRAYSEVLPTPTPTNTNTFTPTATNTFTPTVTNTFTPTVTNTFTPTKTFTPTATATATRTFTPTNTVPGPTDTPTATATATDTPTETATSTVTLTPTITLPPTLTFTPGPTRTPGNIATAFWDGAITYGDTANVIVTSLLCMVVVLGLMSYLILTNLQRNRKR